MRREPFRPEELEGQALAAELHNALIYNGDPAFKGAVRRIAQVWGKSAWTVRDVLRGKIRASLGFLHAACIATSHHPRVRRFLEPRGAHLVPDAAPLDPSRPLEEVLTDVGLALADLIRQARRLRSAARRGRRRGDARQAAQDLAQGLDALDMSCQQARAALAGLINEDAPPAKLAAKG